MKTYELHREQWVPHPLPAVFEFFANAANLERITPPWLSFKMLTLHDAMQRGTLIAYKLRVHGVPVRWLTQIEEWDPPHRFVDVELKGPYALWHHTHRFREVNGGTMVEDTVRYALPLRLLGRIVHRLLVRRDVEQIFAYREQQIHTIFP